MKFLVDVLLIALICVIIGLSAKKGLFSSLIDSFAIGISAFASYKLCPYVAQWAYKTFMYDMIKTRFSNALENDIPSTAKLVDKVLGMINSLPQGAVRFAEATGINFKTLATKISPNSAKNTEELINQVVDKIAYNIIIAACEVFSFIALFIIITLLLKGISKLFGGKINDIPLVGNVNVFLGGVFGVVKAALLIVIVCTVLYYLAGSSEEKNVIDSINLSKIYTFINENNPLLSIFGLK